MASRHPSRRDWSVVGLAMAVAVLAGACATWRKQRDRDRVGRELRRIDEIYAARAEEGRLDEAIAAYLDLLGSAPDDPRISGRLARAFLARGYGFPEASREDYRLAREYGLRCLAADQGVAGLVRAGGGILTAPAVEASNNAFCVIWTGLAWSRWLGERGPAEASLDLAIVQTLGRRGVDLSPGMDSGRAYEALALALALPPLPLEPDLGGALAAGTAALAAAPGRLTLRVDLAEYVHGRQGDEQAWREELKTVVLASLAGDDPDLLENRRAQQRARQLLEPKQPPPDPWSSPWPRPTGSPP